MTTFAQHWRGRAKTLATFGDSITEAVHIVPPALRWANRLAADLGVGLDNRGISGTVMQASPDAGGAPRDHNGLSRHARDLLGETRADLVAILYGTNDARYTAAPRTFGLEGFVRDYRTVVGNLVDAGFSAEAIVLGSPTHLPDAGFAAGSEGFTGQTRERYQRFAAAVKDIAIDAGTFYAPVNERLAAEGGDALILADHVHPNPAGHARIAAIFAEATRPAHETRP